VILLTTATSPFSARCCAATFPPRLRAARPSSAATAAGADDGGAGSLPTVFGEGNAA